MQIVLYFFTRSLTCQLSSVKYKFYLTYKDEFGEVVYEWKKSAWKLNWIKAGRRKSKNSRNLWFLFFARYLIFGREVTKNRSRLKCIYTYGKVQERESDETEKKGQIRKMIKKNGKG